MSTLLGDLRISDLLAFLAVVRTSSISSAARERCVSPSQVSKSLARLEDQLGVTLLQRGARGVAPSEAALRLLPEVEDVVARLGRLHAGGPTGTDRELTLAAPSYVCDAFLPRLVDALPEVRVRAFELPPAVLRSQSAENGFALAISTGTARLPDAWSVTELGHLRFGLFASPGLAARLGGLLVREDDLREIPFVSPAYQWNGRIIPADDGCPLDKSRRLIGHEVATIRLALSLAARSEQLVFGPIIAALDDLSAGSLVELRVEGWARSAPLFVACNPSQVSSRVHRAVCAAVRHLLDEIAALTDRLPEQPHL
jgi:DNA-binding transcriptional LysR family regulator